MINKAVVEQYLRANGIDQSATDDDIKSVLFSAKWHQDDVETALMVLRENPETHEQHVDALHKVFHNDDRLEPETISNLLGIDVEIQPKEARITKDPVNARSVMTSVFFGVIMSGLFLLVAMWYLKTGIFFARV